MIKNIEKLEVKDAIYDSMGNYVHVEFHCVAQLEDLSYLKKDFEELEGLDAFHDQHGDIMSEMVNLLEIPKKANLDKLKKDLAGEDAGIFHLANVDIEVGKVVGELANVKVELDVTLTYSIDNVDLMPLEDKLGKLLKGLK